MSDINLDALAEATFSHSDPQFFDEDKAEKIAINEAIDEVKDTLETALFELKAVKQNFTRKKFDTMIRAIEEIIAELEEGKEDVE